MNFCPVKKIKIAWALRQWAQFISFLPSLLPLRWSQGNTLGSQLLLHFSWITFIVRGCVRLWATLLVKPPSSAQICQTLTKTLCCVSPVQNLPQMRAAWCLCDEGWSLLPLHISFSFLVPLSAPTLNPCKNSGSTQHSISSNGCLMLAILCTSST